MHMKMELNVCKQGSNELPGFRFHPTEQELVGFYLKRMVQGKLRNFNFIPMLDLYRYDPWELSSFANLNEKELFFFVPRDERCQNNRGRPNRMTVSGYWKATGSDRSVHDDNAKCIGLKKTLVFYRGRAPRGLKTDWIMNEYRLPDYFHEPKKEIVLCRIYKKATPLKWLEQQAMNQAEDLDCISHDSPLSPAEIFDDNKRDQETESNCVRNSDSVACHEIRTEPSNYPQDKVTKSNITGSLGCVVDSGLMESTVCGNFIDPEFSSFADDCQKFEGFSSIMALLNSSPSPASSSIECCWENPPMVEEPRSFPIPKLSIDFCNEEAASDGNWNLWMDLSGLHDMNSSLLS